MKPWRIQITSNGSWKYIIICKRRIPTSNLPWKTPPATKVKSVGLHFWHSETWSSDVMSIDAAAGHRSFPHDLTQALKKSNPPFLSVGCTPSVFEMHLSGYTVIQKLGNEALCTTCVLISSCADADVVGICVCTWLRSRVGNLNHFECWMIAPTAVFFASYVLWLLLLCGLCNDVLEGLLRDSHFQGKTRFLL